MRAAAICALLALAVAAKAAEPIHVDVFNYIGELEKVNETSPVSSCANACTSFQKSQCVTAMGGESVTVIMVADPGEFSGSPERMHYVDNLKDAVEYDGNYTMCLTKTMGTLFGEPVVVVASGIGPTAAALCTAEILLCAENVKEIIYAGTSGWSPQPGGVLNNDDCSMANQNPNVNRIGDICVSPFSVNWNCKKADYDTQCDHDGSLCYYPTEVSGPNATYLYGNCEFYAKGNGILTLADELLEGAKYALEKGWYPTRNEGVKTLETTYWGAMEKGTYGKYYYNATKQPVIYNYTECMEVDGQFFYSGVPWEMVARKYIADVINAAKLDGVPKKTQKDVIAVAAMEAIGISEAMERWAKTSGSSPIPYVSIRGMSNQLHHPVAKVEGGKWVTGLEVPEDFENGYAYAIATESTATLSMFHKRCIKKNGDGNKMCDFKVKYPAT